VARDRKRGRYDALPANKELHKEDDDDNNDDHPTAALAYATPHSLFPVAATLHNQTSSGVEDVGGDTDIDSDGGCNPASDGSVQEERSPAQLITSMQELIMQDWEEDSESGSECRSSVGDSTDDNLNYDDDDEYNVNI